MVSSPHEALHQIFREDPRLFARALPKAGITLPEPTDVQLLDTDLTEIRPLERRVDTLLRVDTANSGSYLLAIEMQGRRDPDKLNSWTYYLAHLYAKYELPPVLLVICQDKSTASWAAEPIRIGPSTHTSIAVFPLVLGPDNLPAIIDPDEAAQDLGLSAFSVLPTPRIPLSLRYWTLWRRHSSTPAAKPRRTGRNSSRSVWATPGRAHYGGT
ncbi:hypothetical protein [Streptomyces sp. NBC_00414]|uniref:hypothetical protein n=1 Tax=Streptomyces sp. NBC_00414 TaxID=2975739 RepID=UPI002E23E6C4